MLSFAMGVGEKVYLVHGDNREHAGEMAQMFHREDGGEKAVPRLAHWKFFKNGEAIDKRPLQQERWADGTLEPPKWPYNAL